MTGQIGQHYLTLDRYPRQDVNLLGDVTQLPFRADTFGAVVCCDALPDLDGDGRAIMELARVLHPDGLAVLQLPQHPGASLDQQLRRHGLAGRSVTPAITLDEHDRRRFGIAPQQLWICVTAVGHEPDARLDRLFQERLHVVPELATAPTEARPLVALDGPRSDSPTAVTTDGSGRRDPIFVIGPPRSGSTFLAAVLSVHPRLLITNETRVMTFVKRSFELLRSDRLALMLERQRFLSLLRRELPGLLDRFYRELGASDYVRWGDKFPMYADPKADSDCLALIDDLFPHSQFIHIFREPHEVVASLMAREWTDLDEAIDVWSRHAGHARAFGYSIGLDRYHEVRYEDLVSDGRGTVSQILDFLDVEPSREVTSFVDEQSRHRTPFSAPTTALNGKDRRSDERLSAEQMRTIDDRLADLLVEFGYRSYEWRAALGSTLIREPTSRTAVAEEAERVAPTN